MKGLTKVQWINLNQNNRSVLTHQYSVLWEKTGPILPSLVNLTAGREAGPQTKCGWVSKFLKFFNYSGFYYHSNVTTELELHFSQLLSSKAYFKVFSNVKNLVAIFFTSIPTIRHNDIKIGWSQRVHCLEVPLYVLECIQIHKQWTILKKIRPNL